MNKDAIPTNPPIADSVRTTPYRIMAIDDTLANLTLINSMLSERGFEVFAFPSGTMALRAAERFIPDLVLLDITMPEMDGYTVCEHFKANSRLCDVPIIFLSALSDTQDKVKGFKVGGVDFITKPFQYEEVHARVTLHLKMRDLQMRLQEMVDAKVKELTEAQVSLMVEQKLRAEAVKESQQRLAEIAHMNRNATATVYSAALAHELNQPLAAIMSNTEAAEMFLKMDPPLLKEVQEILADIRRDDQRASGLIKQMRSLLKKSESEFQDIDLNQLVQDVMKFLAGEIRLRDVNMTVLLAPSLQPVSADRIQLQQVMINLIINSMDAMADIPEDGRNITIATSSNVPGMIEVTVQDSGTGFTSDISKVFDSFFTTKTHGMGLGLSITSAIIKAHGGQIRAENADGGGAIVRFTLPLKSAH
jgi:signal transduction histidine kinase